MRHEVSRRLRRLYQYSGANSLISVFVFLILLPTCILIFFYYIKSSDIIEHEVTQSILETLKQADINISNKLDNVENISESIFVNKEVMDFVGTRNDTDIPLQAQQSQDLRNLFSAQVSRNDSLRVRMFISDAKMASSENVNFFPVSAIAGKDWYRDVVNLKGALYWTGVYNQAYIDDSSQNVISCARVLKNTFNYNDNDGILLVDISKSNIYSVLSAIHISRGQKLLIVDGDGRVVSSGTKRELGKVEVRGEELEYLNSGESGTKEFNENGNRVIVIYQTIGNTGWKLVDEVNRADIIKTNLIFSNISLFVIIVAFFILLVFGIFLMIIQIFNRLNRQVKKLELDIEKEGVDIIDEGAEMASYGDYIKLETYVYGMIRKVKALMEESYQSKIREREAQLTALQAQINPHFLYNTLDAVNWMAVKIDAADISFMINSLAKYFRLSLSKGKTVVSIRDELELIEVYLVIQNVRYQGTIQYLFDVDEDIRNDSILKLTLQPIIENAILHGIQKKADRRGLITVKGVKTDGDIRITITDDGVGMDTQKIESILGGEPEKREGHYGLYNVDERLKLYYGSEYGITITSEPGKGTRVEVKIKAQ